MLAYVLRTCCMLPILSILHATGHKGINFNIKLFYYRFINSYHYEHTCLKLFNQKTCAIWTTRVQKCNAAAGDRSHAAHRLQERWLSPTERASVSAISLRHIIWLPHESHACMSLPSAVAGAGIESLRHILASLAYAPGTIAVNVTRIDREFNACQTPRSMYTSIFNRFPVIQPKSSKVRHFSTFFGLPWVRPWDNRGKYYMDGKRIQCL